ncbi:MAG: hypothetical protein ACREUD_08305, partial [Gammaproteobacteria bacterium]
GPPTGTGGNGQIDSGNWGEAAAAWAHMAAAGFLQGSYSGVAGGVTEYTDAANPAAPANAWNGYLLLARTSDYAPGVAGQAARLHLIMGRNVPVNIMRELDAKLDDGQPNGGILRSAAAGAAAFDPVSGSEPKCVLAGTPAIWDINVAAVDCNGYYLY